MSTANGDLHEIEMLLPFYVNGTLEAEEHARVDDAVAKDPKLAVERRTLERLRETMQDLDTGMSPGQFGLARVLKDIERSEPKRTPAQILPWGISAAAVAALVAVVIVSMTDPNNATFTQASGDAGGATLTVAFQPDATQAEISSLLLELGLEVVGGPSAIGLYHLNVIEARELDAIASVLRERGDLVESVDMP